MATGYTHPVCDGEITEFNDFAMSCARAFGALIMMRDEPMDAEIPDEFKPSDYNEKALAKARARLTELQNMTPEHAEAAAVADYDEKNRHCDEYEAKCALEDKRLAEMMQKVSAWGPPTSEHVEMKNFMLKQLSISMNGDYRPERPKMLTGQQWVSAQLKKAEEDVGYHAAEQAKENERAAGRTQWVKALRESLAPKQEAAA